MDRGAFDPERRHFTIVDFGNAKTPTTAKGEATAVASDKAKLQSLIFRLTRRTSSPSVRRWLLQLHERIAQDKIQDRSWASLVLAEFPAAP